MKLGILLFLVLGLFSCFAKGDKNGVASPEPYDRAWWLRPEFAPIDTHIRGIPVKHLDSSWSLASEISKEAISENVLYENGLDLVEELKLSFSILGDFNNDGVEDLALIGLYENSNGKRGTFLLVLSREKSGKWKKSFLETRGRFAAFTEKEQIIVFFCMGCDFGAYLLWDKEKGEYVLKTLQYGE